MPDLANVAGINGGPLDLAMCRDGDHQPSWPQGVRWPAQSFSTGGLGREQQRGSVVHPLCGFRTDRPYFRTMALGDHASRGAATFGGAAPHRIHQSWGRRLRSSQITVTVPRLGPIMNSLGLEGPAVTLL